METCIYDLSPFAVHLKLQHSQSIYPNKNQKDKNCVYTWAANWRIKIGGVIMFSYLGGESGGVLASQEKKEEDKMAYFNMFSFSCLLSKKKETEPTVSSQLEM